MKPPAGAVEVASAALRKLPHDQRPLVPVAVRIANALPLTPSDVASIESFWARPPAPAESQWRLAAGLLGGEPMRRAVTAAPAPPGDSAASTGVMIAVHLPEDVAEAIAVPDGLPPEDLHITLAYLGHVDDLPELAAIEAAAIAAEIAASGPWPLTLGHVAHLGGPDVRDAGLVAVAYDVTAPALHVARADLVSRLSAAGVEYSDRFSFRPHITLTYLPEAEAVASWPEGPIDDPATFDSAGTLVSVGEVDTVSLHTAAISPVTAAAGSDAPSGAQTLLDRLGGSLADIDRAVVAEVRAAVELGWGSALDRVGRMATRNASGAQHARCKELAPAIVAASMFDAPRIPSPSAETTPDRNLLEGLNVGSLIAPAVSDTVRFVRNTLTSATTQTVAAIESALAVEITDPGFQVAEASAFLERSMTDWLLFRLGVLSDPGRIDPADGDSPPLAAPFSIARNTLAIAGGAAVISGEPVRDEIGRPLTGNGTAGSDGVASGPAATALIREALLTFIDDVEDDDAPELGATQRVIPQAVPLRGPFVAAARRRAGARISDSLRDDLADAAGRLADPADPLEAVTTFVWRINYNGTAVENLPRHKKLDGRRVSAPNDVYDDPDFAADPNEWPNVGVSFPGDHPYCHCGWETSVQLVPVQQELAVT